MHPPHISEVTARALVVDRQRLLVVSDEGEYWYLRGGRLELGKTLLECAAREVAEETGLRGEATDAAGTSYPTFLVEGAWLDGGAGARYMGPECGSAAGAPARNVDRA